MSMVIGYFLKETNNSSNAEVLSDTTKLEGSPKFYKEYSYEYFIIEERKFNRKPQKNNKKQLMQDQTIQVTEAFSYQPTQYEGTNSAIFRNENVPSEVIEGIEFVDSVEEPFFNQANMGVKVSVIPGQAPLFVRSEADLID